MLEALHHGGRLREAAQRYGIPLAGWLDLSTGINPQPWPVPAIDISHWQRLPEEGDGLEAVAAAYYGSAALLPLAGSQAAIQLLPQLRTRCRVGVISPGYAEHAHRWHVAGHTLVEVSAGQIEVELDTLDVLLLINPNNPDGTCFQREQLLAWHECLAARGGWLIVDEAFMDVTPEQSLVDVTGMPGLVVLRSLGKFFGLAGARVGFCAAWPEMLQELRSRLGPWSLAGPSREVARLALLDSHWQAAMRIELAAASARLAALLERHGLRPDGGTALFQYVRHPQATIIADRLARQGILVRWFEEPAALRFGLPGSEVAWERLDVAMRLVAAATWPVHPQAVGG